LGGMLLSRMYWEHVMREVVIWDLRYPHHSSGVRSSGVWYCVSGLVSVAFKEQSAFICKIWGVEQSSQILNPWKCTTKVLKSSIISNPLTVSHLSRLCSLHLLYISARVYPCLYLEVTCKLISCM
jgi:hypothetical protein